MVCLFVFLFFSFLFLSRAHGGALALSGLSIAVERLDKTQVALYTSRLVDLVLNTIAHSKRPDSADASPTAQGRAIDAMVALTMKLSERMFRPLISRIQEWATAGSGAGAGADDHDDDDGGGAGDHGLSTRFLSFVQLIDRLVQDLRSLFCPYFEYFLDMFLDTLQGSRGAAASTQKRKRLKLTDDAAAPASAAPHLSQDELEARCHIVNALYHLVLYDKGSILDDSAKVLALVEPLTKQLQVGRVCIPIRIRSIHQSSPSLSLAAAAAAAVARAGSIRNLLDLAGAGLGHPNRPG